MNQTLHAWSGTALVLNMYLYSHGQGNGGWDGLMHTFMDPSVTLSGEWAERYRVVWSPGISQASEVPEPSSLSLLAINLTGLAVLGFRERRRRARAGLAAGSGRLRNP